MLRGKVWWVSLVTGQALLFVNTATLGQTIAPAQTALEAASAGAVRARSPGRMVGVGVAATLAFGDAARVGVQITETMRPVSIRSQLLASSLALVFEQFNQLLALFTDLLLARAGIDATVPTSAASQDTADDTGGQTGRRNWTPGVDPLSVRYATTQATGAQMQAGSDNSKRNRVRAVRGR